MTRFEKMDNIRHRMQLGKVFFFGMFISFLGSLPLGSLNLVATYISVADGKNAGTWFAIGCLIAEVIFVRLALIAMSWINERKKLFRMLEWITLIIILLLAVLSCRAALTGASFSRVIPVNIKYPFLSGLLLSTLDPMKIPFWFLWSTFLMGKNILLPYKDHYNYYVVGIGIGSFFGFLVFIYGGVYLVSTLKDHQDVVNWAVGGVLLATVIIQLYRMTNQKELKVVTENE